jgi:hypothetical protein
MQPSPEPPKSGQEQERASRIEPPRILMLCRENGLYGAATNGAMQPLLSLGYDIQMEVLPADLTGASLEMEIRKIIERVDPNGLVCDYTTDAILKAKKIERLLILDDIFTSTTEKKLAEHYLLTTWGRGNPLKHGEDRHRELLQSHYLEECGLPFTKLLSEALSTEKPDKIYIFTGKISDHLPFRLLQHVIPSLRNDMEAFEDFSLNVTPDGISDASINLNYPVRQPAEVVRDWVLRTDFPSSNIFLIKDYTELHANDFHQNKIWIIGDRHLMEKNFLLTRLDERFMESCDGSRLRAQARQACEALFTHAKIFRLPIETFASDLIKYKLVQLPEEYEKNLLKMVSGQIVDSVRNTLPIQ